MLKFNVEAGKYEYDGDEIFEDCDYCDSFETFELAYAAYEKYRTGMHWARITFTPFEGAPESFDITPQIHSRLTEGDGITAPLKYYKRVKSGA